MMIDLIEHCTPEPVLIHYNYDHMGNARTAVLKHVNISTLQFEIQERHKSWKAGCY